MVLPEPLQAPSADQYEMLLDRLRSELPVSIRPCCKLLHNQIPLMPFALEDAPASSIEPMSIDDASASVAGAQQLVKSGKLILNARDLDPAADVYSEVPLYVQVRDPGADHYKCFFGSGRLVGDNAEC